jgi:hypothetical protein
MEPEPNGTKRKTGNRKPEMENRPIDQFPASGFLFPVFHFSAVIGPARRRTFDPLV